MPPAALQNLGRTAIFSSSPYIDSAVETLITTKSSGGYTYMSVQVGTVPCCG